MGLSTDIIDDIKRIDQIESNVTSIESGQLDTRYYTETEIDAMPKGVAKVASNVLDSYDSLTLTYTSDFDDTTTTTAAYAVGEYIYDTDQNLLYECIQINTIGILLTNVSYFTQVVSNTLSITNGNFLSTNGKDANGYIVNSETFTGSIDFTGVSDGLKYVAKDYGLNTFKFYDTKPSIGLYDKTSADDNRLVFQDGELWSTTGGELVANGDFATGDLTGWTNTSTGSGTAVVNSETLELYGITNESNLGSIEQSFLTDIGDILNLSVEVLSSGLQCRLYVDGVIVSTFTSTLDIDVVATNTNTVIKLENLQFGATAIIDNISVYKIEATLDTPIAPISFLETPVFVASETPVDFREDEDKVVRNVMESTAFSGLVELNENRKVIYLGTLFNNNRYVVDNPFGNDNYMDCDVRAEVQYSDGEWYETSEYITSGTSSYGTKGYSNLEGIVVVTGYTALQAGNPTSAISSAPSEIGTSAPVRAIVTYVGETK